MDIRKVRIIGIAATVGAVVMLCMPVTQATICTFACTHEALEPATLGLLALGLAGVAMARRRK
jgi:hypothetical protein